MCYTGHLKQGLAYSKHWVDVSSHHWWALSLCCHCLRPLGITQVTFQGGRSSDDWYDITNVLSRQCHTNFHLQECHCLSLTTQSISLSSLRMKWVQRLSLPLYLHFYIFGDTCSFLVSGSGGQPQLTSSHLLCGGVASLLHQAASPLHQAASPSPFPKNHTLPTFLSRLVLSQDAFRGVQMSCVLH